MEITDLLDQIRFLFFSHSNITKAYTYEPAEVIYHMILKSRSYDALLQLNGTILVGLFIFISLAPLNSNDILDLETVQKFDQISTEDMESLADLQSLGQGHEEVKALIESKLSSGNLSSSEKTLLTNNLEKINKIIDLQEQSIKILYKAIQTDNQSQEIILALNHASSTLGYSVTAVLMAPFLFSIFNLLITNYYGISIISTCIGLFLIFFGLMYFQHQVTHRTDELSNLLGEKIQSGDELFNTSMSLQHDVSGIQKTIIESMVKTNNQTVQYNNQE